MAPPGFIIHYLLLLAGVPRTSYLVVTVAQKISPSRIIFCYRIFSLKVTPSGPDRTCGSIIIGGYFSVAFFGSFFISSITRGFNFSRILRRLRAFSVFFDLSMFANFYATW